MTGKSPDDPAPCPAVMVIHGPAIFDAGDAEWLISRISPRRTIVAGVMARTAAEESGLPVLFDSRPPSRVIRDADGPVFLANRGKTPASGRIFGEIVAARCGPPGLVQVECSDRRIIRWDSGDLLLARSLASRTGFPVEAAVSPESRRQDVRQIRGCIPGEPVYVNGIVIGRATAEVVELRSNGNAVRPVAGLIPKLHGMEKLRVKGSTDLGSAWCKSGSIRSAGAGTAPRTRCRHGRVIIIDHCGHRMYSRLVPDCCGVLAIGDDTTAVSGHICSHRGIPVLGITDNDADAILPSSFAPGSLILDTRPRLDDDIGREIAAMVRESPVCWDDWVREVLGHLAGRAVIALDLREGDEE